LNSPASRNQLTVALVGPDPLEAAARRRLAAQPNVRLLDARPYSEVPAYLQHADVVVVPSRATPFTDSLDPIKAYECLAVGTPTVATPVAGFRGLSTPVTVAPAAAFVEAVRVALALREPARTEDLSVGWEERARAFEDVLVRALTAGGARRRPEPDPGTA